MGRVTLAFFLSLLLHILLILLLLFGLPEFRQNEKQQHRVKLNLEKIKREATPPPLPTEPTPKPTPKPEPKPEPIKQPIPQRESPKKEVKKEETKKIPKEAKKETTKKVEENTTTPPKEVQKPKAPSLSSINNTYKNPLVEELYSDEFDTYTEGQKEFIKNSLNDIGRITQKHLRYPDAAGRMRQQGKATVEFYLHPNGDITDLKLIGSSRYALLDRNSLHTINTAYKDYPRPSEKTKIRIYIHYIIR